MAKKFRHQLLGLFFLITVSLVKIRNISRKVTKLSPNVRDKLIIIHDDITPSKMMKPIISLTASLSFVALSLISLSKLVKKATKHPLPKRIKLNDNFPESNSKTFLTIPTPYNDGTNWTGRTNQTTHPSVIQFKDKWKGYKYWMTFTPYPYGNNKKENPSLVASHDGINWMVPPNVSNPIVSNKTIPAYLFDTYLSDSHLLYNNDTDELELWYRYVNNRQKKRNSLSC